MVPGQLCEEATPFAHPCGRGRSMTATGQGRREPAGSEQVRLPGVLRTDSAYGIYREELAALRACSPPLTRHRCNMKADMLNISTSFLGILIPPFPGSERPAALSSHWRRHLDHCASERLFSRYQHH